MTQLSPPSLITALIYEAGEAIDVTLRAIAGHLRTCGVTCAGVVQRDIARPGRSRCDMTLVCLDSGESLAISEDRGEGARGCRLDADALLRVVERTRVALAQGTELVVINKFGKAECEGGGFRPLIAEALEAGVPVLIAVPWRNVDAWRRFAGECASEHRVTDWTADGAELCRRIGLGPSATSDTPSPGLHIARLHADGLD